jgi:hypothetical protein
MRRRIAAGIFAAGGILLGILAGPIAADAQTIENGVGVLCESPQQVEQFIALHADSREAVEQINTQNNARVCEILNVAFLVGGIVAETSNDRGTWQIHKILIVGVYVGSRMSPVQPYEKYTAFLASKAAPI